MGLDVPITSVTYNNEANKRLVRNSLYSSYGFVQVVPIEGKPNQVSVVADMLNWIATNVIKDNGTYCFDILPIIAVTGIDDWLVDRETGILHFVVALGKEKHAIMFALKWC